MAELNEPLTERELEIVRLVSAGLTNKEIASQISVSPNTVKVHLNNVFTKLGLHTRTEVTVYAIRSGWVAAGNEPSPAAAVAATPPREPSLPLPPDEMAGQAQAPSQPAAAIETTAIAEPPPFADATHKSTDLGPSVLMRDIVPFVPIVPKVAPNPTAMPPLAAWRKVALIVTLTIVLVGSLISLPTARGTATPNDDGTNVPSTIENGFLAPGESSRWFQRANLPAQRARAAAVAGNNNHIFLIGGETNQTALGDVLLFDRVSNSWRSVGAPKPTPVWNVAASVVNNIIYVAGGTTANNVATNRLEAYDIAKGIWRVLAPLPRPIAGHAMTTLNEQLYVFGGKIANATTGNSYVYDIASDTWRPIAPMPTPRSLISAAALNDRIYVVGGYDDGRESSQCEVYTPASNTWAECAPMLLPRGGFGLARVGNTLYAIGGGQAGFVGFNERYDAANNRWTSFETPHIGNWRNIAVASSVTEFYVIGGYNNNQRLNFTYVYEVFNNRTYLPDLKKTN
ncbi:MAG: LuxR C-terminal-related transcriptional regulator [Anaerolineae bacterium]|nr:LuxR C-terminal-related transcriptional regulator [Anaerolineae bacterium]